MKPAALFVLAAARYWIEVHPRTCWLLRRIRGRALGIEDGAWRALALEGLGKRGNIEGAAAFATLARRRHRRAAVRALVAYQTIYNLVDTLEERPPGERPCPPAELRGALVAALEPSDVPSCAGGRRPFVSSGGDGGYVERAVEDCRAALRELPRFEEVAACARRAAVRIAEFQRLSAPGGERELARWAEGLAGGASLAWWEMAGAAGSSLLVCAAIATAADGSCDEQAILTVERAYFPSICALHSLLDSVVDEEEDRRRAQLSLIERYPASGLARERLRQLARSSAQAAQGLAPAGMHAILLRGMAAHYLSQAPAGEALLSGVRRELGPSVAAALLVFKARAVAGACRGARARLWSASRRARSRPAGGRERSGSAMEPADA